MFKNIVYLCVLYGYFNFEYRNKQTIFQRLGKKPVGLLFKYTSICQEGLKSNLKEKLEPLPNY